MSSFSRYLSRLKKESFLIVLFILTIWIVFFLDRFLPLEMLGLRPRNISGLVGVFTMSFLHGDLPHILSNTFPLIVLLLMLVGSRHNSVVIVIAVSILGGFILWTLGSSGTLHIGASLLVFGLAGFLLTSGFFFEPRPVSTMISFIVLIGYGGALMSGFAPWQKGVSWDGHLYGFVAGTIVAFLMSKRRL